LGGLILASSATFADTSNYDGIYRPAGNEFASWDCCAFRGDPATHSDLIRPGIPGHPATPKPPDGALLRGDL
jgi:hypothetical protein